MEYLCFSSLISISKGFFRYLLGKFISLCMLVRDKYEKVISLFAGCEGRMPFGSIFVSSC